MVGMLLLEMVLVLLSMGAAALLTVAVYVALLRELARFGVDVMGRARLRRGSVGDTGTERRHRSNG